ncbi:MAG: N-acetylneuraminate synthase family protein [Sulfuricella denitrificans]|nr:N-acetylneuraminate synthase family protein [Sulfuricella denitrificans]
MSATIPTPLFVLEMANNHMGDVEHGVAVIRAFGEVCRAFPFHFAFKLQYRDLDTFIHPAARGRDDIKYVKRFSETRLSRQNFDRLVAEMRTNGFLAMSTPFDEPSVDVIEAQRLDIVKIASCSFTDWPLLERVVLTDKPVIASTAGASLEEIDRVVSFLAHRQKDFAILHCVGEYPTPDERMHLSQIDFLRARYPGVRIGFSTHEQPDHTDIVKLAVAKGVTLFEKHVGLTTGAYPLNAYSASPEQVRAWLQAAQQAWTLCGVGDARLPPNPEEVASLRSLRRGVFARRPIAAGETIRSEDVYFAFPPQPEQFTANDWSKYAEFTATSAIALDQAIAPDNAGYEDRRACIWDIAQRVKALLARTNIVVPGSADLEVSHHYGLDRFDEFGLVLITVVNRCYCKKLLVVLPGQSHPEQYHMKKEETFHVLQGEILLELDGVQSVCRPGDVVTIEPGVRHAFRSEGGAVIEEISTTHDKDDSYYTDTAIMENRQRKSLLTYWMD